MSTTRTTFHESRNPPLARAINRIGAALDARPRTRRLVRPALDVDAVLAAAARRAGRARWDDDAVREPLGVFLDAFERDARPTLIGRLWARELSIGLLVGRLQIEDTLRAHPEIRDVPVREPVFILGLPRTGTTLLHNLIALDPAIRAPLAWELDNPCPPPRPGERPRGATRATRWKLALFNWLTPGFHVGHLMRPDRPDECMMLFFKTFVDYHFFHGFAAWSYLDWFLAQDMTPTYRYYRLLLQSLMLHHQGARLALKYPYHVATLDVLWRVFPDARVIQTHRDPRKVIPSIATLAALGQSTVTDRVDLPRIARALLAFHADGVRRGMAVRAANPDKPCFDLHYLDLLRDPIAAIEALYAHFGWTLTRDARAAMQRYLDDNPQHKFGVFRYSLDACGLDAGDIDRAFADYCARHGVTREP